MPMQINTENYSELASRAAQSERPANQSQVDRASQAGAALRSAQNQPMARQEQAFAKTEQSGAQSINSSFRNALSGYNILDEAENALDNIQQNLNNLKNMATAAADEPDGTAKSQSIQAQAQSLARNVDANVAQANYRGNNVFEMLSGQGVNLQVGNQGNVALRLNQSRAASTQGPATANAAINNNENNPVGSNAITGRAAAQQNQNLNLNQTESNAVNIVNSQEAITTSGRQQKNLGAGNTLLGLQLNPKTATDSNPQAQPERAATLQHQNLSTSFSLGLNNPPAPSNIFTADTQQATAPADATANVQPKQTTTPVNTGSQQTPVPSQANSADRTASSASQPAQQNPAQGNQQMTASNQLGSQSLNLNTIDLTTQQGIRQASTTINQSIDTVANLRSQIGQNREAISSALTNSVSTIATNPSAQTNRIYDNQLAKAETEAATKHIIQNRQAAASAQANAGFQSYFNIVQPVAGV